MFICKFTTLKILVYYLQSYVIYFQEIATSDGQISAETQSALGTSNMASSSQFRPGRSFRKFRRNSSKDSRGESFGNKVSVKAYDRNTDSDIFSLGSAFKQTNFNIDDFFNNMPSPSGQTMHTITTTTHGGDGKSATQVTTIRKTNTPISSLRHGHPGQITFPAITMPSVNDRTGSYGMPETEQGHPPIETVQRMENQVHKDNGDSTSQYEGISDLSESPTEPLLSKSLPRIHEATSGIPEVMRSDMEPGKLYDVQEDDILEEFSSGEEMNTDRVLRCGKKPNQRFGKILKMKQLRTPTKLKGHEKGKAGMTASEVLVPGEEKKLPAVQLMVMNFSRMLDVNLEQFVETLFRAVKLNGVDVVKILCQLVMRKGLKLSSEELREPESSATVLHVALLCNHEHLAEYLINISDKDLIMSVYTNPEYRKQTALHVAVANGNQKLVKRLLSSLGRHDKRALINTIADGSYFVKSHPDGQLCLTVAAWAGNGDILITLAKHGANFAMADTNGNTLMHRLVIASALHPGKMNYPQMVDKVYEALGEWAKRCRYRVAIADQRTMEQKQKQINTFHKLLNVQNNQGETPFSLAAQLGSALLVYLMNLESIYKIPQTKLGSISWVTYDVTDITTLAHGQYNKFSVLHVLAHNSGKLSRHSNLDEDAQYLSILETEPIKSLIEMKWSVYRWVYVFWLFLHLLFLFLFTYFTFDEYSANVVYMGAYTTDTSADSSRVVTQFPVNHYLGFGMTLPVIYMLLEFVDWFGMYPYSITYMRNESILKRIFGRLKSEWVITGNGPYRFVCFSYSVFTIWWFIMYETRTPGQDIVLSMALLFGWIFVLFFTRGCRVTSRFSIMIQKMFFRDLMYFLAVYIVILAAFSISITAMYSFGRHSRTEFPSVMYQMLNIITDLDQRTHTSFEKDENRPLFTKILLIFYAIVAVILLMNMLIAMMNTSYETVRITRCNLCKQQQLSIMLMLERRLFWWSWLSNKSERDVWLKDWDDKSTRAYLDVTTTTHTRRHSKDNTSDNHKQTKNSQDYTNN